MGVSVALCYNIISTKFSYKFIVLFGLCVVNCCIISFLVVSIVCKNMPAVGFSISIALCFIIGFFGVSVQLSYCSMINFFGAKTVVNYSIGSGMSGLIITLIRVIITAIYL